MEQCFYALCEDDVNDVILAWQNTIPMSTISTHKSPIPELQTLRTVNMVHVRNEPERPKNDELTEKWKVSMFESNSELKSYVIKDVYVFRNLSEDDIPHIIKVYEKIFKIKCKYWRNFCKRNK